MSQAPSVDLNELTLAAEQMRRRVETTADPATWEFDDAFKVTLRLVPRSRNIQLLVMAKYRQANPGERAALRQAFAIPETARVRFDYLRGWGVMKITWPRAGPEQLRLGQAEATADKASHYRR